MQMMMMGAGGGNADVLALAGYNETRIDNLPSTVGLGYQLTSTGKERGGSGTAGSIIYSEIGDWVLPNGSANLYEVRATLTGGSLSSGTTGVWLPLSSTQTWTRTQSTGGSSFVALTIEIRLVGGPGTILASATVNLDTTLL